MSTIYVQFSDELETTIISVFAGPQNPDDWPRQGEVASTDPRYLDFRNRCPLMGASRVGDE
jgi:hypothetical protein